ncbi:MAG: tetratricopeptide repeat protein [Chloroflexi bacterium]|nr:tetratricopeptide repeat protein [Chloroflexota bacterium]
MGTTVTQADDLWLQFDAASAHAQAGRWAEAIPPYEALLREAASNDLRAHVLNDLGVAYQSVGALDKALEYFQQAWDVYEAEKNRLGAAIALGNLGTVHAQRREWDAATYSLERSLTVFENLQINNLAVAKLRMDMGDALAATGQPKRASEQYTLALAQHEAAGDKRAMALTLHALGAALRARARWPEGIDAFQRSAALFEELGDAKNLAITLNRLGELYYEQRDYEQAVEAYRRELKLSEQQKNQSAVAHALNNLGLAYLGQKQFQEAAKQYRRAIALWQKLGDEAGLAMALWGRAQLHFEQDEAALALEEGTRALAILERLESKEAGAVRKWLAAARRGKRTGLRRYF